MRRSSRALCHGDYRNVVITNRQLLFERNAGADGDAPAECVLVAINAEDAPFTFNDDSLRGTFEVLVASSGEGADATVQTGTNALELDGILDIPPFSVIYLRK